MIKKSFISKTSFAILLAVLSIGCQTPKNETAKKPKALFIIVDGIAGDVIQKLNPPVLSEISKEGGFTLAHVGGGKGTYSETPTISAVGYNSLLTGTWVKKHNVWDNDIADPNYHYWNLFRIVKESNPGLKTAVFSTWEDNRTKLIAEGMEQAGKISVDFKFDGLELDTVRFPHDKEGIFYQRIDDAVAEEAAKVILKESPDLSWVYLEFTDEMGHRHGDSPQFTDAVMAADKQIGKIWTAIKKREQEFNEDWLIVVTTDHGRDAQTGHNHGGQSDRERSTWIVTDAHERNERFNQNPGIVDIFPSILNHLNIQMPDDVNREVDGVTFIGPADLSELHAQKKDGKILLTWTPLNPQSAASAEVLVTETNHFKEGGQDTYRKVGEASVRDGKFEFAESTPSNFYKIVLKTPDQYLNVWLPEKRLAPTR
jgi:predicted AlkP superfamily pyrophosphatase or phosphodiesterase